MLQGLDTLLSIIPWASYNQLRLFKPPALRCAGVVSLLAGVFCYGRWTDHSRDLPLKLR